jgi:hypothetical protein
MSDPLPSLYPGSAASPRDLCRLADEFRAAAELLHARGRRGTPLSWAPYRLTAIHAIELYLSAFLLHHGEDATGLRKLHHDLAARSERARALGLVLRARTAAHLESLTQRREYLTTRYEPAGAQTSPLNRLQATLDQVASKVTAVVIKDATPRAAAFPAHAASPVAGAASAAPQEA